MARIDLFIPSLGNEQAPSGGSKFVDLRDSLPGDSYNWSWTRPLSQVKYLAIHHSASPDTQTPLEIANYHISSNGWGGIGYHFVIAKDGTVFYVGDISSARANVANLNEQVIGICLVGNFTQGRVPSSEQLDSTKLLCDFFINYPDLSNVKSYDAIRGHKELPNQSTACPGDSWPGWRSRIVVGDVSLDRGAQITNQYRTVLGREPDIGGLQNYTDSAMAIDEIMRSMVNSQEHQNLIQLGRQAPQLKDQLDNLQSSLGSLNQQLISLQQKVGEKDTQINWLKTEMTQQPIAVIANQTPPAQDITTTPTAPKQDNTLTLFQALFNLYKFVFMPGKVS